MSERLAFTGPEIMQAVMARMDTPPASFVALSKIIDWSDEEGALNLLAAYAADVMTATMEVVAMMDPNIDVEVRA